MLVDVDARADVAKERTIAGKSRHSSINPAISAIVPAEPVLHSEVFTLIKMTGVKFYAAVKIIAMHSF